MIKFSLPIYYTKEFKTKKWTTHLVGANWFRNLHPHEKNKLKQGYHKLVSEALRDTDTRILGKYSTEYKYCFKSSVSDASNVISQVEKFALDGLKEYGYITDDSVRFHVQSDGWTVEEDKTNPRLEIIIRSIDGRT